MLGDCPRPALPQFSQHRGFTLPSFWEPPCDALSSGAGYGHPHPASWDPYRKEGGENGSGHPAPPPPSPTPPREGVSVGLGWEKPLQGWLSPPLSPPWHCKRGLLAPSSGGGTPQYRGTWPLVSHLGGSRSCFGTDALWPPPSCVLSGDAEPAWGQWGWGGGTPRVLTPPR